MDPDNPIVKLCVQGMECESSGRLAEALGFFMSAWMQSKDDFERCVAAHYVALHQKEPVDRLLWNQRSLDHANAIPFKALRVNCAASNYDCQADPDHIKLLFSLLNDKKFGQALKKVNQDLEKVFVNAELHHIAFIANSESGNKDKAEFHKAVVRGLLDSIQENKHGKSEEDAFVVINVHEEYTFLRFSNCVRSSSQ